jgi:hypothetical protein
MIRTFATLASSALTLALATPAIAQDITADPNFGTHNLQAGFSPDPYTVSVTSGGGIAASNAADGCVGTVSDAPDVRLSFSASDSATARPLIISVDSTEDTTLLINAPDGSWYCDDDSGSGSNPMVVFGRAQSGRYEIWVGTYSNGEYHSAQVRISELLE